MTTINFYRQMRNDGGKRTGIEVNGGTVLGRFEKGKKPEDSALLWFVDIRCSGGRLPIEAEAAREWLLDKTPVIQQALRNLVNELQVGIDFSKPIDREIPNIGKGITSNILCSAIRRLQAGDMAKALAEINSHWEARLNSLEVLEPLAR